MTDEPLGDDAGALGGALVTVTLHEWHMHALGRLLSSDVGSHKDSLTYNDKILIRRSTRATSFTEDYSKDSLGGVAMAMQYSGLWGGRSGVATTSAFWRATGTAWDKFDECEMVDLTHLLSATMAF
jgi:hypothetical protein